MLALGHGGLVVSLRDVRRVFPGGVVAVDGVSLEVPAGQFVALLGPSGCGKSTLLRMVAGLDRADGGTVRVARNEANSGAASRGAAATVGDGGNLRNEANLLVGGHPGAAPVSRERAAGGGNLRNEANSRARDEALAGDGQRRGAHLRNEANSGPGGEALGRGAGGHAAGLRNEANRDVSRSVDVAYVFQDAHLLPWRTVLENAALPLELKNEPTRERRERAAAVLESVGLGEALGRYPAQLSGGMRMRVSLARALVTDPKLLLLDEPFAALDEITRQRLDEMLRELWQDRRMTVLFVTHSISEATFLAERAVVFSRRPARVVLDQAIDLPDDRTVELRAEAEFGRQMRELHRALEAQEVKA